MLGGDADRHADPMGWPGITDGFAQADLLGQVLEVGGAGSPSLDAALAEFHRRRNAMVFLSRATGCGRRLGINPAR